MKQLLKKLYKIFPFKKQLFIILKKVSKPKESIYKHLHFNGIIKIDVETHEAEVLEGFSKYIKIFKPIILIEILNDTVGRNVEKLVEGNDYLFFNIDEKKGIRQVNKITRSDYYNYLLCSKEIAIAIHLIN